MNTLMIILGTLGSVFAAVLTALSVRNAKKPRVVSLPSTFLAGAFALGGLLALLLLGEMWLEPLLGIPLLLVGLLLGFLRGQAVKLDWAGKAVLGRNSTLFILLWGLSLGLSQLLGLLGSPLLASLGLVPVLFSTGLQLGFNANLFLRRLAMRRKAPEKNLHTVIGLAGSLALLLLVAISLVISLPELIAQFPPGLTARAAGNAGQAPSQSLGDDEADAQPDDPQPTASLAEDGLPASGSLILDCAAQEQRIRDYSLRAYNFGSSYTFEQAFLDYQLSFSMGVDLDRGSFTMDQDLLEVWRWQDFDPEQDPPEWEVILNSQKEITAAGSLLESGWITGSFSSTRSTWGPEDEERTSEADSNDFFGYLDEAREEVTVCLLAAGANRQEGNQTADLAQLQAAGMEALIGSWWNPAHCYTCQVAATQP